MSKSTLTDTLNELETRLRSHFKPGFLQRNYTAFQFCFTGDDLPFYLSVTAEDFQFITGQSPNPTLTLYLDSHESCLDLLSGRLDGMEAFMSGRYRADGNIVLSQLLLYLFKDQDPTNIYQVQD